MGWPFSRWLTIAAQWFVRLRAQPVTARLDKKFRRWLAADPSHEIEYERHELVWELTGELGNDKEVAGWLAEAERTASGIRQRHIARHTLTWSLASCAVAALAIGLYFYSPSHRHEYITGVGEQRTVVLPDKSRMELNTGTRVRVLYERKDRIIELDQGEATFRVTHDPTRPFEVRAAQGTARALGTEFNVLSASREVTVSVLSGKVEVVAPDSVARIQRTRSATLLPGQEVSYSESLLSPVQVTNSRRIFAWHSGRVAFDDLDLQQALADFNRYNTKPIVLGDASLARLRVSGVFRIGETDALLRALHTAFGIQAEHHAAAIVLRAPKGLTTARSTAEVTSIMD